MSLIYLNVVWFDVIHTILYLFKDTYIRFKERKLSHVFHSRGGRRVTDWGNREREELMRTRFTHLLLHSLTPVMKLYWERNACVRQSLSSISLKTGKFPPSFNSKTSVYTKQSNIWQHLQVWVSWSRFIEALEKHCSVRVNWCQTCAFEIMLFISQLFLLDRLSLPFQTQH